MSTASFPTEILKWIFLRGCEDELDHHFTGFHRRKLKEFAANSRDVCRLWREIIDDSKCFWVAKAELEHDAGYTGSLGKSLNSFRQILRGSKCADLIISLKYSVSSTVTDSSLDVGTDDVPTSTSFRLFLHGMDMLMPFQTQIWGIVLYSNYLPMHWQFGSFIAGLASKKLECVDLHSDFGNASNESMEIGCPIDTPKWVDRNRIFSRSRSRIPLSISLELLPHLKYLEIYDSPWVTRINLSTISVRNLTIDSRWIVCLIKSLNAPGDLCANLEVLRICVSSRHDGRKVEPIGWNSEKMGRALRPSLACLHRLALVVLPEDDWAHVFLSLYSFPALQDVSFAFYGTYADGEHSGTGLPTPSESIISQQIDFPLLKKLSLDIPRSWANLELVNLFSHSGIELDLNVEMIPSECFRNGKSNRGKLMASYREMLARFRYQIHRLTSTIDTDFECYKVFQEDFNSSLLMEMSIYEYADTPEKFLADHDTLGTRRLEPLEHQQNLGPIFPKLKEIKLMFRRLRFMETILFAFRAPELESLSFHQNLFSHGLGEVTLESPLEFPCFSSLRSITCSTRALQISIISTLAASAPNVEKLAITIEPYSFGNSEDLTFDRHRVILSQNRCLERLIEILGMPTTETSVPFPNLRQLNMCFHVPKLYHRMEEKKAVILEFLDHRTRTGAHPLYLEDIVYPKFSVEVGILGENESGYQDVHGIGCKLIFESHDVKDLTSEIGRCEGKPTVFRKAAELPKLNE